MALIAEEIVEEWLNRDGWFTIRGIKLGVQEIDILAIKPDKDGCECRHVEVQVSIAPVSYISNVPKQIQKAHGRSSNSAKMRVGSELTEGVSEWIAKKFDHPKKRALKQNLIGGNWSRELVVHNVAHDAELQELRAQGIVIHYLGDVIAELSRKGHVVPKASGADIVALLSVCDKSLEP